MSASGIFQPGAANRLRQRNGNFFLVRRDADAKSPKRQGYPFPDPAPGNADQLKAAAAKVRGDTVGPGNAGKDAESGKLRLVDTRSQAFRDDLASRAATRQKQLRDQLRATGMDLVVFDASGSMVDPLLRFLRERERRLRR